MTRNKLGFWFLWILGNGVIGFQGYKYVIDDPMGITDIVVFGFAILLAYNLPVLKNTLGTLVKRKSNEL